LIALAVSIAMLVILIFADGVLKGLMSPSGVYSGIPQYSWPVVTMSTWVVDLRYFFEEGIYASTVLFVGAKFFETRNLLSVGFDRLDASNMVIKGPDDDNIIWTGRRYGAKFEAESVVAVLTERLKESATT
jgi:hypothetical protein